VTTSQLQPFPVRAERVLTRTYRGIHHAPKIHKRMAGSEFEHWEVNHYGDLSTYDFDTLTRLVVAAHEDCVRASISSSGPRMVKITLHNREGTEGSIFMRHPRMQQAVTELLTEWA